MQYLGFFNIKKMRGPSKYICLKMKWNNKGKLSNKEMRQLKRIRGSIIQEKALL